MAAQIEDVRKTLAEARKELLARPNVLATGVGYKVVNGKVTEDLALICSVDSKKTTANLSQSDLVPQSINQIPTDVYPTGLIHALADPTGKFRPAPGGVSIGHINITAGTLGCLVQKDSTIYILSNNHVLANSNDASAGDPILQPGPADGGSYPADHIAELGDFIPIEFDGGSNGGGTSPCPTANLAADVLNGMAAMVGSETRLQPVKIGGASAQAAENLVDCALAKPLNPDDVKNEILEIGTIGGLNEGALGMSVKKSGRTTGFTTATITQIDVTVQVSYGAGKVATFVDQLMTGYMSAGGDSGSAVLDSDNQLVGLLFAGSSNTTIINRIQNVFDLLQVSLIS